MSKPLPPDPPAEPFDISAALKRVRKAVAGKPRAALFELRDEGYGSVFEVLVACLISIRTFDEVTLPTARKLFAVARTPAEVFALGVGGILRLIAACQYADNKARQIHEIARVAAEEHGGALPADRGVLLGLKGVGPKCANLTLGVAAGQPLIAVDTHVHRVTNRWGYVKTKTPEQTLAALEEKLPRRHRVEINELLVPFGKHVCTPASPRCSACPVRPMCARAGVTRSR